MVQVMMSIRAHYNEIKISIQGYILCKILWWGKRIKLPLGRKIKKIRIRGKKLNMGKEKGDKLQQQQKTGKRALRSYQTLKKKPLW